MRHLMGALIVIVLCGSIVPAEGAEYRTFVPDGAGPFPAVLFVSGCSGFAPALSPNYYPKTAERLRSEGYYVLFVDYLGARGFKSCAGTISHDEAGRDVVAALAYVRTQPKALSDAVTAIGWSYGGGTMIAALATLPANQPAPLRAVLLYPDCRGRRPWKALADVLVLFGGKDDVAAPDHCRDVLAGAAAQNRLVVHTYPQGLHAFDVDELPARTTYPFGTIGYHKESATAAWTEIDRFLKAGAGK